MQKRNLLISWSKHDPSHFIVAGGNDLRLLQVPNVCKLDLTVNCKIFTKKNCEKKREQTKMNQSTTTQIIPIKITSKF